jgi:hypothetical protein
MAAEENPDIVLRKIFIFTMIGSVMFITAASFITLVLTGDLP